MLSLKLQKLLRFNKIMAGLHALQGIAVLVLATDFSLPVTTSYQVFEPTTRMLEIATRQLFEVNLAYLVAAFFFMSALAHFFVAVLKPSWYIKCLKQNINIARWVEYAFSASTMMVAIGLLAGVEDLSTLLALFGFTALMNLMGWIMESHNHAQKKINWLSYWIGVIAGIIPWVIVALYFWGAESSGAGDIPTFVYFIYGSIFAAFNVFAINMIAQYKQWRKWSDYLYGERAYIILSLVAKSALAWQIFAGTLRPI